MKPLGLCALLCAMTASVFNGETCAAENAFEKMAKKAPDLYLAYDAPDYPEAQWGDKLADVAMPAGKSPEEVGAAAVKSLRAYGWEIECSNDSTIIGSYLSGGKKHPIYLKYDATHVEIYADKKINRWAQNVRQGVQKFIGNP